MLPMTVLSPVLSTTPLAVPSTTLVEKKAMLRDSMMFRSMRLACSCTGSLSPVRLELST